jgi:hypothetical protein
MGLNLAHGKIATLSGDVHVLTNRPVCMHARSKAPSCLAGLTKSSASFLP